MTMPGTPKPKRLDDVSHLFLSSGTGKPRARAAAEICIWLLVDHERFVRGYAATGLAAAIAARGVDCTLLETGTGLPNAGFYFSLSPAEYLAPALDGEGVVEGQSGDRIVFVYAPEPAGLVSRGGKGDARRPHVVLLAWSGRGDGTRPAVLRAACRSRLRRKDADGQPAAIVRFGANVPAIRFESGPAPLVYLVDGEGAADERFALPGSFGVGAARPVPPGGELFDGLAASLLQRAAGRRKEPDETGVA